VPNSGLVKDVCGVCGGDGATCGGFEPLPTPRILFVDLNSDQKSYRISVERVEEGSLVYYTLDGSEPNILNSERYLQPFVLEVSQFQNATKSLPLRSEEAELQVVLRFRSFPAPNAVREFQSQIATLVLTFDAYPFVSDIP